MSPDNHMMTTVGIEELPLPSYTSSSSLSSLSPSSSSLLSSNSNSHHYNATGSYNKMSTSSNSDRWNFSVIFHDLSTLIASVSSSSSSLSSSSLPWQPNLTSDLTTITNNNNNTPPWMCNINNSELWTLEYPICTTKYETVVAFVIAAVVLIVITLWTVFGNILVLVALYKYKSLRTMSNCLIGNLAISDLLLAITVLPVSATNDLLGYWVFGDWACTIWLCMDVLYCTASVWGLCTVAFDRYMATTYPVMYHDKRSVRKAVCGVVFVWIFSIIISFAPFIGWQQMIPSFFTYNKDIGRHECILFMSSSYVIYSSVGSFVIPTCLMTFMYIRIFKVLHRQSKTMKMRVHANGKSTRKRRRRRRRKVPDANGNPSVTVNDPDMDMEETMDDPVTRDFTTTTLVSINARETSTYIDDMDDDDDDDIIDDDSYFEHDHLLLQAPRVSLHPSNGSVLCPRDSANALPLVNNNNAPSLQRDTYNALSARKNNTPSTPSVSSNSLPVENKITSSLHSDLPNALPMINNTNTSLQHEASNSVSSTNNTPSMQSEGSNSLLVVNNNTSSLQNDTSNALSHATHNTSILQSEISSSSNTSPLQSDISKELPITNNNTSLLEHEDSNSLYVTNNIKNNNMDSQPILPQTSDMLQINDISESQNKTLTSTDVHESTKTNGTVPGMTLSPADSKLKPLQLQTSPQRRSNSLVTISVPNDQESTTTTIKMSSPSTQSIHFLTVVDMDRRKSHEGTTTVTTANRQTSLLSDKELQHTDTNNSSHLLKPVCHRSKSANVLSSSDEGSLHSLQIKPRRSLPCDLSKFGRNSKMTLSMKRRFELREQRATKRMVLIMACFCVCWMPFVGMYITRSLCHQCDMNTHLVAAIIWLGYVNSSLNPVLYSLFNDDFKAAFKRLLGIGSKPHRRSMPRR